MVNKGQIVRFNNRMNKIAWHPFTLGFVCGMWFVILVRWLES